MPSNDKGACLKEKFAQSDSSLGVVQNNEVLARIILSPVHIKNAEIASSLFPIKDLLERNGWSFVRKQHLDNRRINRIGKLHAAKGSSRKYAGYAKIQASDIRGIRHKNCEQAICVIDDAQKDCDEHALAQASRAFKAQPSAEALMKAREIRKKVMDLIEAVLIDNP